MSHHSQGTDAVVVVDVVDEDDVAVEDDVAAAAVEAE